MATACCRGPLGACNLTATTFGNSVIFSIIISCGCLRVYHRMSI